MNGGGRGLCAYFLTICALLSAPAQAQARDWSPRLLAQLSARSEANIFRMPDDVAPGSNRCRDDKLVGARAEAGAEGHLGGWDGDLNVELGYDSFSCNRYLNNLSYHISGRGGSSDIGPLNIAFTSSTRKEISSFADIRGSDRNDQYLTQLGGTVGLSLYNGLRVSISPFFAARRNSNEKYSDLDYDRRGGEIVVGYFSPLENHLALVASTSELKFTKISKQVDGSDLISPKLITREIGAKLLYNISPYTRIESKVFYAVRDGRTHADDDYRGILGYFKIFYHSNMINAISMTAGRRLSDDNSLFFAMSREDFAMLKIQKGIASRVFIEVLGDYSVRRFSSDPLTGEGRGETDRSLEMHGRVGYSIGRRFSVEFEGGWIRRNGSSIFPSFSASNFGISLVRTFGAARLPQENID